MLSNKAWKQEPQPPPFHKPSAQACCRLYTPIGFLQLRMALVMYLQRGDIEFFQLDCLGAAQDVERHEREQKL
jgi:hypothetical protein